MDILLNPTQNDEISFTSLSIGIVYSCNILNCNLSLNESTSLS